MLIYVSFIHSLFLLILYMWNFSNVLRWFPFFSVFMMFIALVYSDMCVLCSEYGSNIQNYRYYSELPVYVLYIWDKTFGPFALHLLVGNPGISFGKCHFFHICLFVNGVVLCFVSCFVFRILLLFVFLYNT
jgi:hypothetical protein